MERVYLFYVQCVLEEHKIDPAAADFVCRRMSNSSERQLGAFMTLYAMMEGQPPPLLAQRSIELRNDCVHKGLVPTSTQAERFADEVMQIIDAITKLARTKYPNGKGKIVGKRLPRMPDPTDSRNVQSVLMATTVSLEQDIGSVPFDVRLRTLARDRGRFWRA